VLPGCKTVKALPIGLPFNYYRFQIKKATGQDICTAGTGSVLAASGVETNQQSKLTTLLDDACGSSHARAGFLSDIALNAVQGLGDFLVARAKQEFVGYAVETQGRELCEHQKVTVSATESVDLFPRACGTLFPEGTDGDADLVSVTDGRLQVALRADLAALPDAVARIAAPPKTTHLDVVIAAMGRALLRAVQTRQPALLFSDALARIEAGDTRWGCDLATVSADAKPACITVLALQVGATAVSPPPGVSRTDPAAIVQVAATEFCAHFSDNNDPPGACVFGAAGYPRDMHPSLSALVSDATDLTTASTALVDRGLAQPALEGARDDASDALDRAFDSIDTIVRKFVSDNQDAKKALDLLRFGERVASGYIGHNSAKIVLAFREALATGGPLAALASHLPRPLALMVSIAMAESRSDVEAILDAAAAPLGSYSTKYGTKGTNRVAINGYVGPAGGWLFVQNKFGYTGPSSPKFFRLSAPVGVDWTIAGFSKFHLGFGLRLIDPLALTVVTKDGAVAKANWSSLFDLGAYFRVGVWHSPFSVLLSGSYQPGLTSEDTCTVNGITGPCWKGAWQLGGAVAIDIPIWFIH
jgi:hypothetical protein